MSVAIGACTAVLASTAPGAAAEPDHQAQVDAIRNAAKTTGAIAVVKDGDDSATYASGSIRAGADVTPNEDDRVRVASNTKTFVATVILQLVDEGEIDLDAPIGSYLPGLVTGKGIDENTITVRQLLQHTSGIADYDDPQVIFNPRYQWFPPSPRDMITIGLNKGSQSAPGRAWSYSNTGYVILGQLVEKVTGQRIGDAIQERISAPLGLEETTYAYAGEKKIEGRHFAGYVGIPPALFEVSGHEPGLWSSAGALISSGSDMTTFSDALLRGELMSDGSLAEMKKTFSADEPYGLGLGEVATSCGTAWGHNGSVPGYMTFSYADGKGRSVFAAYNTGAPMVTDASEQVLAVIDSALCGDEATGELRMPKPMRIEHRQFSRR